MIKNLLPIALINLTGACLSLGISTLLSPIPNTFKLRFNITLAILILTLSAISLAILRND